MVGWDVNVHQDDLTCGQTSDCVRINALYDLTTAICRLREKQLTFGIPQSLVQAFESTYSFTETRQFFILPAIPSLKCFNLSLSDIEDVL